MFDCFYELLLEMVLVVAILLAEAVPECMVVLVEQFEQDVVLVVVVVFEVEVFWLVHRWLYSANHSPTPS